MLTFSINRGKNKPQATPEEDRFNFQVSPEESKDMQNKKPRVTAVRESVQQSQQRKDDHKPWHGWRGKGDFRVLKSHVKQ